MTSDTPGGGGQPDQVNGAEQAEVAQANQTNQGWEDLRRTAEEALQQPSARTAPVRTRATTWLILGLIVACVIGVGVWVIVWFVNQDVNGQRIRMRTLEEKAAAYQRQVEYTQVNGHMPDGVPTPPLTDAEAKELEALHRKFGITPATKPAAAPVTPAMPVPPAPATRTFP